MNYAHIKSSVGKPVYELIQKIFKQPAIFVAAMLIPAAFISGCSGIVAGQSKTQPPPPSTYSISGTISPVTGGNGATVTLSGTATATATANSSGSFTFSGLANGTYIVTPSHSGYTLSPAAQTVTVNGANIVSVNFTATAVQGPTFSLSGTISPITGGAGATVTLSGAGNATTIADNAGNYSFTGLNNGAYAITPSHAGYTFSPASQNATINAANLTGVNFTATAVTNPTFSISGTLAPAAGGVGATVTLSGGVSATTTADSAGNYTFTGLHNGSYAVTPSHVGYTFSPSSQNATVNGANVGGLNFTATPQTNPTFSISGTISPAAGGSGATVLLSGAASASTTTNSSGAYSFTGLPNGSYTVTPANTGFTFSPANQSVPVNGSNVGNVNFTASAVVSHTVALSWNASTSTVTGYNVYRTTVSGSGYTRMNSSLIASLGFTDAVVTNGTTYYYVTTAMDSSGAESGYSNEVPAVIP